MVYHPHTFTFSGFNACSLHVLTLGNHSSNPHRLAAPGAAGNGVVVADIVGVADAVGVAQKSERLA